MRRLRRRKRLSGPQGREEWHRRVRDPSDYGENKLLHSRSKSRTISFPALMETSPINTCSTYLPFSIRTATVELLSLVFAAVNLQGTCSWESYQVRRETRYFPSGPPSRR